MELPDAPSVGMLIGEPMLLICPNGNGAARINYMTTYWTGKSFVLVGTVKCICCSTACRVVEKYDPKTYRTSWVALEEA